MSEGPRMGAGTAAAGAAAPKTLSDLVRHASLSEVRQALQGLTSAAVAWSGVPVERQTLLFQAVAREEDALEVCRLLLDEFRLPAAQEDVRGQTALHYLARTGHVECVDLLVGRGCKVDHVDTLVKQTPLFYAVRYSSGRMVRRLLELQADPNHRDDRGFTPLFWAESLEACEELVKRCGTCCNASDPKGVTVVEWQSAAKRPSLSRFVSSCIEARAHRGRMSWAVSSTTPDAGASTAGDQGSFVGYATSLARPRDVDQLCQLEDEFIEDHVGLLGGQFSRAELFSQIGLNPDASTRRNTIKSIAQSTVRRGPTRHYTLKCLYMPPILPAQTGTARTRTFEVVGYVYFRVVDGEREPKASDSAREGKLYNELGPCSRFAPQGRAATQCKEK
ncbi:unnamed protein product [Polarella glacialis]|uniref:Uncharacterized protein n=1 Tax=Polarella glacialis TaxID=89957 RepID=A0A813LRB9_POLGL|nr:unnamed protein product [Polarella glacialis]